ncbi:cupin domain-containing protein [Mycobacterium heckeshornense]|uniref:cupin domain-containing protein n=1 Tax=Mycobacterium heckeshornense TaxID=110505 RepID=UPI00194195F6|nr:cupin domain-containing protein [Mycobacterium heckeshornense]
MTLQNDDSSPTAVILTPEVQQALWFLGALVRIRAGGDATAGSLAVLEHQGGRGYNSPMDRHLVDEETFFVIDGEVRIEVGGHVHLAGAGAVAFLPRQRPHGFVVTSPQARFLTLHTPAGFDRFALAAGTAVSTTDPMPPETVPPDPAALAALASSYGIEIVGPPPTL